MTTPTPGRFIVLEGIDGCGKTTQIEALSSWLPGSGLMPPGARLVVTHAPGGTALGGEIRALLERTPTPVEPLTRLFLYVADRTQHVAEAIRPALEAGHWVLSDRFEASTIAYQQYGMSLPAHVIHDLCWLAAPGIGADLTILLDLEPEVALARRRQRKRAKDDAAAAPDMEFWRRVRQGYWRQLNDGRGDGSVWRSVDASGPPPKITEECQRIIRQHFRLDPAPSLLSPP